MCCPRQERKKKGILVDLAGWVYLQGKHRLAQWTMGHSEAAFNRELLQYLVPFLLLSDLIMQTWRSLVFWMTNTKLLFSWTHSKRNVLTMLYKIIPSPPTLDLNYYPLANFTFSFSFVCFLCLLSTFAFLYSYLLWLSSSSSCPRFCL